MLVTQRLTLKSCPDSDTADGGQGLSTQSSAMRHESSPAGLLCMASPTESFPWSSGSAAERPREQHVQNPAASMSDPNAHLGSLRNPFAQQGEAAADCLRHAAYNNACCPACEH